ncbi:MAG: acyl dehydratase [Hyphomicrobiales bacterium]|nr:acyl dehydratase [Hyphomicrobiales bacterium]
MDQAKPQPERISRGQYWQDMTPGRRIVSAGRTIAEADLTAFVNVSGFREELFTNVEYLRDETPFEGRLVPGALVYSFAEGLLVPTMEGTGLAFLHMELDVKAPTFVGDTIHVEVEVIEARAASEGNRGLVRTRNEVITQKGKTVLVYTPLRLMRGRPA